MDLMAIFVRACPAAGAVGTFLTIVLAGFWFVARSGSAATLRLRALAGESTFDGGSRRRMKPCGLERLLLRLGAVAKRGLPPGRIAFLERTLYAARSGRGQAHEDEVGRYLATQMLLATGVAAACGGTATFLWGSPVQGLVLGSAAGLAGWLGRRAQVKGAARRYRETLADDLPEVIDLLVTCADAGMGLEAALQAVVSQGDGPLWRELERASSGLEVGIRASALLEETARRLDSPPLRAFAGAITRAEATGTPVAEVLRRQAASVREWRRQAAEARLSTVPVKLAFLGTFLLLPTMLVLVVLPNVLEFIESGW